MLFTIKLGSYKFCTPISFLPHSFSSPYSILCLLSFIPNTSKQIRVKILVRSCTFKMFILNHIFLLLIYIILYTSLYIVKIFVLVLYFYKETLHSIYFLIYNHDFILRVPIMYRIHVKILKLGTKTSLFKNIRTKTNILKYKNSILTKIKYYFRFSNFKI